MAEAMRTRKYRESRFEDEPILGTVLALPDGRIQPLTRLERWLAALRLVSAKTLEARYARTARS